MDLSDFVTTEVNYTSVSTFSSEFSGPIVSLYSYNENNKGGHKN